MSVGAPPGWGLETFDSLPSTSDHLIARLGAGGHPRPAVLAARQTKGRGSRGRQWTESDRALCLSAAVRVDANAMPWLGYLGSVVFLDAIRGTAAIPGLSLKWPNDVLMHGRKLGGLLVECVPAEAGEVWAVFGFGANLGGPPVDGAAGLAEAGATVAAPVLAAAILDGLSEGLERLAASPPDRLADEWIARAHPVGTALAVSTPTGTLRGRFAGLAADGGLRLALDEGERTVYSGLVALSDIPG